MQAARWVRILGQSLGAAALLLTAEDAGARRIATQVPMVISFDACMLPNEACVDRRDTVKLIVRGETRETAFTQFKVVTGSRTRGEILNDLTVRPQRVLGSKELIAKLTPGAQLTVRATIRRGSTELFLQSVEPADAKPAAAD
jgi:hypothetical protein